MAQQSLEEQIDLEIKKLEMDFSSGVQWSMQIFYKSLKRIRNKAWEAKEMHKREIINAYSEGNLSAYGKNYDKTGQQYYEETYKNK